MTETFDVIIVGAGQAGPPLARRCSREGLRTALIERKRLGGTCVHTGCIPTKALIASARAVHLARRGAEFGFSLGGPGAGLTVDMRRVKARKDEVVRESAEGLARGLDELPHLTVIRGHGCFTGPRRIAVAVEGGGRRELAADRIFLDVGGRAFLPPDLPGLAEVPYLTNSSILALDHLPEHLIIVGGSYVGLEFAQMYRRFGARVTVCERQPRLIGREDADVSQAVQEILADEGVAFRTGAECYELEKRGDRIAVRLACREGAPEVEGSHLLLAVGRQPNTGDLGLEAAGVATDERGWIEVDDQLRTSAPGVWALGEVNGRGAFTHTAYNDYEIVAANLFDGGARRVTDRIPAYALFTDPPLGRAGKTAAEVRASGRPALIAKMPMTRVGRAREEGETKGFMKVVVDAESERILGAALLGLHGDEAVHTLLDVMYAEQPYTLLRRAVHIHPTVSELLPTLLEKLEPLA